MGKAIYRILSFLYNIIYPLNLTNKGKNSKILFCDGHSVHGSNNIVTVGDHCTLFKCKFIVNGNNNIIKIGNYCRLSEATFWISGDGNCIKVGNNTSVGKHTQFAALEGTAITIGEDCMFSHDILVRTSDSHSIVNEQGERMNHSKDIVIGNHCWIGLQCLILKGSYLAENSVLAARATLNKQFKETGCIIGGAPAKIIKQNINWDRRKK